MICSHCHATVPDDAVFCTNCGQRINTASAVSEFGFDTPIKSDDPAPPVVSTKPPQVGSGIKSTMGVKKAEPPHREIPNGTGYAPKPPVIPIAAPATPVTPVAPVAPPTFPANKTNSRKLIIILSAIAAILLVILIVGFSTEWFGLGGPAVRIATAASNTLKADNFTADFTLSACNAYGNVSEQTGTVLIAMDPDNKDITLYGELAYGRDTIFFAIYKGNTIVDTPYGVFAVDVSAQLEDIFQSMEESGAADIGELIRTIAGSAAYREIQKMIDLDLAKEFLMDYLKNCLNNTRWLKENAGYTVTSEGGVTIHSLQPNLCDFLRASLPTFRDCIRNESDYQALEQGIDSLESNADKIDVKLDFGIRSGKLVRLALTMREVTQGITAGESVTVSVDFKNINRTEIDFDLLQSMLNAARRIG